jgi:hypothetical protein
MRLGSLAALAVLGLAGAATVCGKQRVDDEHGKGPLAGQGINEVLNRHADRLMALPGVVGTGVGECQQRTPCVKVFVVKKTPELLSRVPATLEGFPVVVEETGEIRALDSGHR